MQQELDAVVGRLADRGEFSGGALIARGNDILAETISGSANFETDEPLTVDTRFSIASLTKGFTAAVILSLAEESRLSIDDTLGRHIPEVPAFADATLRHLLTHQAGTPRDFPADRTGTPIAISEAQRLDWIARQPPAAEPDRATAYSNVGFYLLTLVAERSSGKPIRELYQERIFTPLGMTSATFELGGRIVPESATGYVPGFEGPARAPFSNLPPVEGATGIYATPRDVLRWITGLKTGQILTDASRADMLKPYGDFYGLGIGVYRRAGRSCFGHDGSEPGFTCFFDHYKDSNLTLMAFSNVGTFARELLMESAMLNIAFGDSFEPPELPAERITPLNANALVGTYRVFPGLDLEVVPASDGLYLRGTGGVFTPLICLDGNQFWYPQRYARVAFEGAETGQAARIIWTDMEGNRFPCERVESAESSE
ncbi:MAG: serine hydrolase domain-containing protein [Planctomycetota bacterium]